MNIYAVYIGNYMRGKCSKKKKYIMSIKVNQYTSFIPRRLPY